MREKSAVVQSLNLPIEKRTLHDYGVAAFMHLLQISCLRVTVRSRATYCRYYLL